MKASVDVVLIFFTVARHAKWHVNLVFAAGLYAFFFLWLVPGLHEWQSYEEEQQPGVGHLFYWLMTNKQDKVFLAVEVIGYLLIGFFLIYGVAGAIYALVDRRWPSFRRRRVKSSRAGAGAGAVQGLGGAGRRPVSKAIGQKELSDIAAAMRGAMTWNDLEVGLYALDLELQPKGGGFVLHRFRTGEVLGPLSSLGIGVSYVTLKRKLGTPPSHLTVAEGYVARRPHA